MKPKLWLCIFCSLLVYTASCPYADEVKRYYRHSAYTVFDMFEPLFYEEMSEKEASKASVAYEVTFNDNKVKSFKELYRAIPEITGYLMLPPDSAEFFRMNPAPYWKELSVDELPADLKETVHDSTVWVRKSEIEPEDTDYEVSQKTYSFHYDNYGKVIQIDFDSGIINLERITPEIYRCCFGNSVCFLIYNEDSLSKVIQCNKGYGIVRYSEKKVLDNEIIITEGWEKEKSYMESHYLLDNGKIIDFSFLKHTIDD